MSAADRQFLAVAVAVVQNGRFVLVGQRPAGVHLEGFWEFPGGKIAEGESPAAAAARECLEETGLAVEVIEALGEVEHRYAEATVRLHFYRARPLGETSPQPPFCWVATAALLAYPFPPANRDMLARLVAEDAARGD